METLPILETLPIPDMLPILEREACAAAAVRLSDDERFCTFPCGEQIGSQS